MNVAFNALLTGFTLHFYVRDVHTSRCVYKTRYGDGVTMFDTPIQPHTGTTAAEQTNPWFQLDLGASPVTVNIDSIKFWNRNGQWGCRTFAPNGGACGTVLNSAQQWNAVGQGAYIGLSDTALSVLNPNFATGQCAGSFSRNCRCGYLTVYNSSNSGTGPYVLSCCLHSLPCQ